MKREVSKEELSIKPTIQYHSIKTILFAILFICSAIPATLYTILGERKEVIATVISIAVANLILFLWSLGIIKNSIKKTTPQRLHIHNIFPLYILLRMRVA